MSERERSGLGMLLGGLRIGRKLAPSTKTREERLKIAQRGEALVSLQEHRGWKVLKDLLDEEMGSAQAQLENERLDAVALAECQARLRTAKNIYRRIEREIQAAAEAADELKRESEKNGTT